MKKGTILFTLLTFLFISVICLPANALDRVVRVTIEEKEIDDYTLEATITGLDSNGKVVWTRTIGDRSYADPSYKEVGVYADMYYYQFGGIITAIEKSSGKELWKNYDMSCPGDAATVMNKDGIIYLFDDNIASIDATPRFGAISGSSALLMGGISASISRFQRLLCRESRFTMSWMVCLAGGPAGIGRIAAGACRCPPDNMPSEARCQADRGINASANRFPIRWVLISELDHPL